MVGFTYNLNGQNRRVGDGDEAVEVVVVLIGLGGDLGVGDLEAGKVVQAGELKSLLVGDTVVACNAADADGGVALDSDADGLLAEKHGVEGGEGLHVGNFDPLVGDVDGLQLGRGRLGEVEKDEGGVRLDVLEVHLRPEGSDLCADAAVGADGRVDAHQVGLRPGLSDGDAIDLELGSVELLLRNLGDGDEKAGGELARDLFSFGSCSLRGIRYLHQTNNEDDDDDEQAQVRPPELLAVAHASLVLALLGRNLLLHRRDAALISHDEVMLPG
jgi:hypothetical protein